jgi:hypothetical protein
LKEDLKAKRTKNGSKPAQEKQQQQQQQRTSTTSIRSQKNKSSLSDNVNENKEGTSPDKKDLRSSKERTSSQRTDSEKSGKEAGSDKPPPRKKSEAKEPLKEHMPKTHSLFDDSSARKKAIKKQVLILCK